MNFITLFNALFAFIALFSWTVLALPTSNPSPSAPDSLMGHLYQKRFQRDTAVGYKGKSRVEVKREPAVPIEHITRADRFAANILRRQGGSSSKNGSQRHEEAVIAAAAATGAPSTADDRKQNPIGSRNARSGAVVAGQRSSAKRLSTRERV